MKKILLITAALMLSACSTMSSYSSKKPVEVVNGMAANGTSSHAIDDQVAFNGLDMDKKMRAKAPSNQTYYFDFNKTDIHGQDNEAIKAQAKYLASHPNARTLLEGHTDQKGSREYNVALGERRAVHVADTLKSLGVNRKQIRVVSFGEEKPAVLGHSEDAYKLNRRVNIIYEEIS